MGDHMSRQIFTAASVFCMIAASPVAAQTGPFRIIHASGDGLIAVAQGSIRTNTQGFRTVDIVHVLTAPEPLEVNGREIEWQVGTGAMMVDCSNRTIRPVSASYLDRNYGVAASETFNEPFASVDEFNFVGLVCDADSREIGAFSPAFENVRALHEVVGAYTSYSARLAPSVWWATEYHDTDRAGCLKRAENAFASLGYSWTPPDEASVAVYGSHMTLPISAVLRCDAPGQVQIFLSKPQYGLGGLEFERDRIQSSF